MVDKAGQKKKGHNVEKNCGPFGFWLSDVFCGIFGLVKRKGESDGREKRYGGKGTGGCI